MQCYYKEVLRYFFFYIKNKESGDLMAVYQNLTGTTSKTFRIGKAGVTFDTSTQLTGISNTILTIDKPLNIQTNNSIYFGSSDSYISSTFYTGSVNLASQADKLSGNVTFELSGAISASASSNLEKDTTISINVSSVDATKLNGTIPINSISSHFASTSSINGSANTIARSDHTHGDIYAEKLHDHSITFSGDVTGSGNIPSNNFTLSINKVDPSKIIGGTIGTTEAHVDLVGNASSATTASKLNNKDESNLEVLSATYIIGQDDKPAIKYKSSDISSFYFVECDFRQHPSFEQSNDISFSGSRRN